MFRFGRRAEIEKRPRLNLIRAEMQRDNEYYMTYDRLHPLQDHSQYMTARFDGDTYRAVSIPPTLELGPSRAEYQSLIAGKEQIVDQMPHLSNDRKQFLKRRFPYWDEWARSGARGIRKLGDKE